MVTEISPSVIADRVIRVRSWMDSHDVDALIVFGAPAALGSRTAAAGYVRYLTGWMTTSVAAMLVLPRSGAITALTMGPHDTRLFDERAGWLVDVEATGGVPNYPAQALRRVRGLGRIATLGIIEMAGPNYDELITGLAAHDLVDAGPAVDELRLDRHPEEVEMHRLGAAISDAMIETAMTHATRPGMTGPRLMADVEHAGRERGAGTPSTWLAIGEAPVTTYMEQAEVAGAIGAADRVQLGTSLTYQGYFAQGLRIGVRGPVPPKLAQYADKLIEIQDAALDAMRPGALAHSVSDVIEAWIDKYCPYERDQDPFRFQSCHGLGVTYVESGLARDLNARRDKTLDPDGVTLRPNMVIEVHPNFTVPELGHICAGDMALITENGAEWITAYPRGLVAL